MVVCDRTWTLYRDMKHSNHGHVTARHSLTATLEDLEVDELLLTERRQVDGGN